MNVTMTIPKTRLDEFNALRSLPGTNTGLRWGQHLHGFLELDKITSEPNKTWCDKLYNLPYGITYGMVLSVLDRNN